MSWQGISDSYPVARKDYQCVWCPEPIRKGEKHYRYVGTYDGDFQSNRAHLECDDAMKRSDPQYLMDGFGYSDHKRGEAVTRWGDPK